MATALTCKQLVARTAAGFAHSASNSAKPAAELSAARVVDALGGLRETATLAPPRPTEIAFNCTACEQWQSKESANMPAEELRDAAVATVELLRAPCDEVRSEALELLALIVRSSPESAVGAATSSLQRCDVGLRWRSLEQSLAASTLAASRA